MNNVDIKNPRIKRLYEDLQGGNKEALDKFWKEIEKKVMT